MKLGIDKILEGIWKNYLKENALLIKARSPKFLDGVLTRPGTAPWYFNQELISNIKSPKGGKVKHKFYTEKGSEYIMTEDGFARRIKSPQITKSGMDSGLHDWNRGRTIFVKDKSAEDFAGKLLMLGDEPFGVITHNGNVSFAKNVDGLWIPVKNEDIFPKAVKEGLIPEGYIRIPYSEEPKLGYSLFEFGTDPQGVLDWWHPGHEVAYIELLPNFKKGGKLIPKCGVGSLIGKVGKATSKKPKARLKSRVTALDKYIDLIFKLYPELKEYGTKKDYVEYLKTIFPKSKKKDIVWHGSNSDFSFGFDSAKKGVGSGSPNITDEIYFGQSPASTLQYVNGINIPFNFDLGGRQHWNALHWTPKEIMGKGRYGEKEWANIPWEKAIRQEIPMKSGRLKPILEFKESLGLGDLSDEKFFKLLGFKKGESFNLWKKRNYKKFKKLEEEGKIKGSNPAVLDIRNPYTEVGKDTYYFERPIDPSYDARYNLKADNEFNDNVTVMLHHPESRIHWLGSDLDIQGFSDWTTLRAFKRDNPPPNIPEIYLGYFD